MMRWRDLRVPDLGVLVADPETLDLTMTDSIPT